MIPACKEIHTEPPEVVRDNIYLCTQKIKKYHLSGLYIRFYEKDIS